MTSFSFSGNIRAFCRFCPLGDGEISAGASAVAEFDTNRDNELSILLMILQRKCSNFIVFLVFTNQEIQGKMYKIIFFGSEIYY